MIRFRQKMFFAPLAALGMGSSTMGALNLGMAGTSLYGMKQSSDQAEEAEKQAKETQEALDRQTQALNKIAKEAKLNPELARRVVQQKQMSSTRVKLFAASPGMIKNLTGFAKDMWGTQKNNMMKAGKIGLGFGAMTYAGNRITTSLKDHDEGNDKKNLGFLGKAALTGAGIGGTYLAAKKGWLGKSPIKSLNGKSVSQTVQSGMEKVGRAVNPIQRNAEGKIEKLGTGANFMFAGMPVVGYLGQRQQVKDQAKQTEKAYSEDGEKSGGTGKKLLKIGTGILGVAGAGMAARKGVFGGKTQKITGNIIANTGGVMKAAGLKSGERIAKSGAQTYAQGVAKSGPSRMSKLDIKHTADEKFKGVTSPNRISGGVSKVGSFFGFYGKGGTNAVQNTANKLAASENGISKSVGKYMQNHKTAANLMAAGGSLAVGSTLFEAGNVPFKAFDNRAYDYEKQQNQQIS